MWDEAQFALSLVVSGLSIGLMYSLIALGFVLVYKATEAINFAQGEFVMLAGFVVALILAVKGMPIIVAIGAVLAAMILFSFGLERIVLRPLLGRPVIAVIWGSMLGVDVHLALVGLKVFPVVILGGLDSVVGAVVGGLIIGLVESLAAGYLDPYVGGGTKDFAPYVIMIIALMFRPYGIFGTRRIERV